MKELTSEAFTRDLYLTGTTETALSQPLTIGVEEEFLLLDPASGSVVPAAEAVRDQLEGPAASRVVFEMARFQLEANSAVHTDLTRLQRDLLEIRTTAAAAAGRAGVRLAACGAAGPPHPASAGSPHRVPAHGLAVRRTLYLIYNVKALGRGTRSGPSILASAPHTGDRPRERLRQPGTEPAGPAECGRRRDGERYRPG